MRRLSIQLKVTLWFTLLMVLLVSIVLVFLFSLGAQSALEGTKSQMMDMVAAGWHEIGSDDGAIEIDDDLEYFKDGIYLSVYDGGGVPLYGAVPRDFDNSAVFAPNDLRTLPSGGKSWYVYDEQKQVDGYGTVWIRSVAEADQIDSTISTLFRFALVILPFFVLFAAVGGYLITRRAFRPVRRIIQTAKEIGEGDDLSRRIALGEGRDEIYTLAAEFDRMFARLEKAFETEKQFTSDASHELRTPLTAIKGWAETMQGGGMDDETFDKGMSVIIRESERLSGIVEELLDFSRMQSGRMTLTMDKIDILAELGEAVYMFSERAKSEHKYLLYEEPRMLSPVLGDINRLRQVFVNILDNALKYTGEGGTISVVASEENGYIRVAISDNGCGIPPEHLPNVKKKFYKANQTVRGSGIGLALADEIMRLHSGSLEIESHENVGTVVTIRIPAFLEKAPDAAQDTERISE